MTKEEIKIKIEKNRELINKALISDEDPSLKKIFITYLANHNEKLIKRLNDLTP